MENTLFSTVLYVDVQEKLPHALEELKGQLEQAGSLQLIVADPAPSEEGEALCAAVPGAEYLPVPEAEAAEGYEKGLRCAKGQYLNFALASATYSQGAYRLAGEVLEQKKAAAVSLRPVQQDTDTGLTPYKGAYLPRKEQDVVDLMQEAHIQPMLQAYFFRREVLEGFRFRPELHDDALYRFLMEVQLAHPCYVYLNGGELVYTVTREDNTSTNPLQYQPWWYRPSVEEFLLPFLQETKDKLGEVPEFVQLTCYYLLYCKYNCNMNDRSKGVLSGKEEAIAFAQATFRACGLLAPETILRYHLTPHMTASRVLRFFLLRGRAEVMGRGYQVTQQEGTFQLRFPKKGEAEEACPQVSFSSVEKELVRIRIINNNQGVLQVDANIGLADFMDRDDYQITAEVKEGSTVTTYAAEELEIYPLIKCFGVTMARKHAIQFHIPVSRKEMEVQFYFTFEGKKYPFSITFDTPNSRMDADNKYAYWLFGKDRMLLRRGQKKLTVCKRSPVLHLKRELLFLKEARRKTADPEVVRRGTLLRVLYWLLGWFYAGKHIWVTFDKQYKAGDNGEYMYQYLRTHAKDVEPYYIIKKDSPDYPRLAAQDKKHTLVFGTLRCQLICLMAEVYLGTHANISAQYNPTTEYRMYTKDIQRGEYICIQHGLTIQKIAQYQNRQFDNIRLYCLASPYEEKNLSHPFYGYQPEELKMTGLARYDGLKSNDRKIILITPTWRKNVVNSNVANNKKTHNSNFKNSAYFRIYNDLINDPTLIDCAKRNGYRIIYLLHPAMSAQMEDFDRNDFVELMPATGDMSYEKILTESSLMVTDYSGVQFDFAYMRKPIVYYHPDELPPHYDAGGLIYETMGFGPICRNHGEIIGALCAAMERQCVTEAEYVRRADDFFAYSDHNNCERIYAAISEWMSKRR